MTKTFLWISISFVFFFREFSMYRFRKVNLLKRDNPYSGENQDDNRYYRVLAEISNSNTDSDGHIMDPLTTLVNFGLQSDVGVQVKDSHQYNNGFGKTFDGRYDESAERVLCGLRISKNWPLSSSHSYGNSNIFIEAILDEVITEVSIGAYGGDLVCNICDASMYMSSECYHWPLVTYRITDDEGVVEEILCTARYVDGHLREVSLVDKGACPGADIIEARLLDHANRGIVSVPQVKLLKSVYGVSDGTGFSYPKSGIVFSGDFSKVVESGNPYILGSGVDGYEVGDPRIGKSDSVGSGLGIGTALVSELGKSEVSEDSGDESDDSDNLEDSEVDLKEAQERIDALNKQIADKDKELESKTAEIKKRDTRIAELHDADLELRDEKNQLKSDCLKLWKENRGINITGEDLTKYEERVGEMSIWNLKEEKNLLTMQLERKSVSSGGDSGDEDTEDDEDDEDEELEDEDVGSEDVNSVSKAKKSKKKSNSKTSSNPKSKGSSNKSVRQPIGGDDEESDPNAPPVPKSWGSGVYPGIR